MILRYTSIRKMGFRWDLASTRMPKWDLGSTRMPKWINTIQCNTHGCPRVSLRNNILIAIVISKLLKRYAKAKRTRAPAYSRALRRIKGGFQRGVKRSSGPISRVPGGDRVAVRVGFVEMGRGNDSKRH